MMGADRTVRVPRGAQNVLLSLFKVYGKNGFVF